MKPSIPQVDEKKVETLNDRFAKYICDDCKAKMNEELNKGNVLLQSARIFSIMRKNLCKQCERRLVRQVLKQGVQ